MVRTFLIDVSMPDYFWVDAAHAAVNTINRLLSPMLQNKTPFEVLFSRVPN